MSARPPLTKYRLPDSRVGDLGTCRGPHCAQEVVFTFNPKSGKKPPYNKDGTPHFSTCVDADTFRGTTVRK